MSSALKYLLFGIVVAGLTYYFTSMNIKNSEKSYEDCVINNVKEAQDESAVNVIKSMCKKKYDIQDTIQTLDKDKVKNQLNEVLDLFKEFQKQIEDKIK
jgi:hypothetical protein